MLFGPSKNWIWNSYNDILTLFCRCSGMIISNNKSILLQHNTKQDQLEEITNFFPFKVKDLVDGTRYLGYYLKPNGYRRIDWIWILKRFDKRMLPWG